MGEEGDDGMSPAKLAARLEVDRATVYRWIKAGRIKAGRYPSMRLRIPQTEVDRIIRELEGESA